MKFRVIVEHDPETGAYAAYCPELPGCCSAGSTEAAALDNAVEAIKLYLQPSPMDPKCRGKVCEVEVSIE